MGKWQLNMERVQEWGEEHEEGVVFGVSLHREPVQHSSETPEAFLQYRTCKVRRLKAATLEKLLSHLQDPGCQEDDFSRILLSTYHSFCSSSTLIQTLFHSCDLTSVLDSSKYLKSSLWTFLQTWLEEFSEDLRDPPQHSSLRYLCLQLRRFSTLFPLAKRYEELLRTFQKQDAEARRSADRVQEPGQDHVCSQADLMEFSVMDLAEQLTRIDADLFVKVIPSQCLGCVWSQRDKKENLSPTIWATIAQFNTVTNRVITSLLCPPSSQAPPPSPASTPTQRAKVIEKWVRVAQGCRELRNFSSLWAILSALQSNPVYRLRRSWAAVSREIVSVFENLCETFPDENCVLSSRENCVQRSAGGAVPYLGACLSALTMLHTALPDTVEGGLINFEKRRREFEVLRQIRQLQVSCSQYVLAPHPQISAWIQSQTLLTDQESYELSRQLETHESPPSSSSSWSHRALTKKLSALLSGNDGCRKSSDQISLSSSGSSSCELEETSASAGLTLTTASQSSCSQNTRENFPSGSISSSSSQQDLSPAPSRCSSTSSASSDPRLVSAHKRSASMSSLLQYNRQVDDSCIIRVSVEFCRTGNMYRSIMLTSQDKTTQVIQRALHKHHLQDITEHDLILIQVLPHGRELHIPEKANVFYAMCSSANYDFILRRSTDQRKHLTRSLSLSSERPSENI